MSLYKVHVEGYGCSLNKAETYYILSELKKAGFAISDYSKASVVVINTCAVKNPTESRMISRIKKALQDNKRVVVAGCLPDVNPKLLERYPVSIVNARSLSRIAVAVKETAQGRIVKYTSGKKPIVPVGDQPGITGIIPISEGCLGKCAYCGTKNARGSLYSYPPKIIKQAFEKMVLEGKKEIFLTSQDTGCYGFDIKTSITKLVKNLLETEGDYLIRIGMMNPDHALKMLPDLAKTLNNQKVYSFLHVPVQSGSDKVLREMNRFYTRQDFLNIVKYCRENVPGITIATDVIVGFPTETEKDYLDTLSLLKTAEPDVTNVSKFYPRPNTAAEKMKKIKTEVIKERSRKLSTLVRRISLARNKKLVGETLECLSLSDKTGRTRAYKTVFFDKTVTPRAWVNALITGAGPAHLKAKVLY